MRLGAETREEADESVTMMVSHLTRLAELTDWALGTAAGQAAEEVVRYTVFASQVPSLPAQRAWEALWTGSRSTGPERWEEEQERQGLAEQAWLSAWEQWRRERVR